MKEYNTDFRPRKKLSWYVNIQHSRFNIIYVILFGLIWLWIGAFYVYTEYEELKKEDWIIIPFLFMAGFWILFIAIGLFQLNKKIKDKNLKERLELEWIRVMADINQIKPYWIIFKFWSTNILWKWSWFKIYAEHKWNVYVSPLIPTDVTKYVNKWDRVPIFIDPQDSKTYYMDIDNINVI